MCKKIFIFAVILIVSFLIVGVFNSCNLQTSKYDKDWIIGKTSSEIEDRYGSFDIYLNNEKYGNNYCETGCGYLTKNGEKGAFGLSTDEFIMIFFDENGVAYSIEENYPRPGG